MYLCIQQPILIMTKASSRDKYIAPHYDFVENETQF